MSINIKVKKYLKWGVPTIIIVSLLILWLCQTPQIISATVSPEVVVKNSPTEVMVKLIAKHNKFTFPVLRVVITERGKINLVPDFRISLAYTGNTTHMGWLTKNGTDQNGNDIYQKTITVKQQKIETVQVQLKGLLNQQVFPETMPKVPSDIRDTRLVLRLAVTARPYVLPPDPGKKNDKTFEGIDSDNDGLRDDLQREIFFSFPESERLRTAIKQEWIADSERLINSNSKELVQESIVNSSKSVDCLGSFFLPVDFNPNPQVNKYADQINRDILLRDLLGYMQTAYNTSRMDAYWRASKLSSESAVNSTSFNDGVNSCIFDWQSLPD